MTNRRYFLQKLLGVTLATSTADLLLPNQFIFDKIALADTSKGVNMFTFFPNLWFDLLDPMLEGVGRGMGNLFQDYIDSLNPYKAQQKQEIIDLIRSTIREYQDNQIQLKLLEIQGNWDQENWKGILSRQETEDLLTKKDYFLILFAPPNMTADVPLAIRNNLVTDFKYTKNKLNKYYQSDYIHKVKFYGGYFKEPIDDIIIEQIYSILSPIPTAIFYTDITDYYCRFNVGYWGFQSDEPTNISSDQWYWEHTSIKMRDNGLDETSIYRSIREFIVSFNQVLASYLIDTSYLTIDPFYDLKFPKFTTDLIADLQDKENNISPYFQQLEGLKDLELSILEETLFNGKIRVNAEKWHLETTIKDIYSCSHCLAIHPTTNIVAMDAKDNRIKLYNWETREKIDTFLQDDSNAILSMVFTPDGLTIAIGCSDNTIKKYHLWHNKKIWDFLYGDSKKMLYRSETTGIVYAAPMPQNIFDTMLDIMFQYVDDLDHGLEVDPLSFIGHKGGVRTIALSGDGEWLASGSDDKTVKIWNWQTKQCLHTLKGHQNSVSAIAFSKDGQILASGSDDKTIKIWDWQKEECLQTLTNHNNAITAVIFADDGYTLISSSDDNTIKFWNWHTGDLLNTLQGHSGDVKSLVMSSDYHTLISGGCDRSLAIWRDT